MTKGTAKRGVKIDSRQTPGTGKRSGGVDISGKNVKIGGDVVGRDKIVKGGDVAKAFEPLKAALKQAPADKMAEAEQKVADLQAQAQSKTPDIGVVGKALKWLKKNVPGVSGALNTVLNQPIIGQGIKDIAAVILED
ncbi:MAG TPA: hypothetical protein VIK33_20820 [Anaerolineae bacterium]